MAKYRSVQTCFWSDAKIIDEFTPEDRYFYLYLLTNQKSNQIGCYELPIKQICRDTGYNEETVRKLLNRFETILEVTNYDMKTKEILLKNWHKYNWLDSSTTRKCIEKEFGFIKSDILKDIISPLYGAYIPHGSKEKEKEKEKKNKKKREKEKEPSDSGYATPTLTDIILYSSEKGIDDDEYCEKFYNHYEAIGWVNGNNNKIRNWEKVFDNWVKKDISDGKIKIKEEETIDEAGFKHVNGRRVF